MTNHPHCQTKKYVFDEETSEFGIPQGTLLGPILYIIFYEKGIFFKRQIILHYGTDGILIIRERI